MTKTEFNSIDLRKIIKSDRLQAFWALDEIRDREKRFGEKLLKVTKRRIVYCNDFVFELRYFDMHEPGEADKEFCDKYNSASFHDECGDWTHFEDCFESGNMAEDVERIPYMVESVIYYCVTRI